MEESRSAVSHERECGHLRSVPVSASYRPSPIGRSRLLRLRRFFTHDLLINSSIRSCRAGIHAPVLSRDLHGVSQGYGKALKDLLRPHASTAAQTAPACCDINRFAEPSTRFRDLLTVEERESWTTFVILCCSGWRCSAA